MSCVVVARDAERTLGAALRSVLHQTRRPAEVVVVDDGSLDGTPVVGKGYGAPVRYVRQERAGLVAALNRGLTETRGELVAFLDARDLWRPEKLDRQRAVLEERAGVDFVISLVRTFRDDPAERARWGAETEEWARDPAFQPRPGLVPGALLARRTAFQRAGPFREPTDPEDPPDWFSRARSAGLQGWLVGDVLTLVRARMH